MILDVQCGRYFVDLHAFDQHAAALKNHPYCAVCRRYFPSDSYLEQHHRILKHPYCARCNRYFSNDHALEQHRQSRRFDHPYCNQCNTWFVNGTELSQHSRRYHDRYYCGDCNRWFRNNESLWQHLRNSSAHQDIEYPEPEYGYDFGEDEDRFGEEGDFEEQEEVSESDDSEESRSEEENDTYCDICSAYFENTLSCHRHRKARHNWCSVCDRYFGSPAALQQHDSSPIHKPKVHKCPICNKYHKVPSATAHHLESGACHGFTRHHVTAAAQSMNIIPSIVATQRSQGAPSRPRIEYYNVDESSFNGRGYECFLCHKTCATLDGLKKHLYSAAHDEDEFKCPKCRRQFTIISGLIQHIESEACGIARLNQVERIANDLAAQFSRALTF